MYILDDVPVIMIQMCQVRHQNTLPLLNYTIFSVMSASQPREAVSECISSGAEDFLVKPVTKKEVSSCRRALEAVQ